jgi:hypothetical protein
MQFRTSWRPTTRNAVTAEAARKQNVEVEMAEKKTSKEKRRERERRVSLAAAALWRCERAALTALSVLDKAWGVSPVQQDRIHGRLRETARKVRFAREALAQAKRDARRSSL